MKFYANNFRSTSGLMPKPRFFTYVYTYEYELASNTPILVTRPTKTFDGHFDVTLGEHARYRLL